jgi:pyruvate formate lyase activating enzyme
MSTHDDIRIGGITPFTTVDWPGRLAAVAWLAGCPWRCPYCHNHGMWTEAAAQYDLADLLRFLEGRRGLLDGVVFSGGEPLAQPGLGHAMGQVRELGFEVALHTAGAYPERLRQVLPELSWVGFDVKAPWDRYDDITHAPDSGVAARTSLQMVLDAGLPMEARTTWHPSLLTPDDLTAIALQLAELGVPAWRVQAYRAEGTTGQLPAETVYPHDVPAQAQAAIADYAFRRA